MVWYILLTGLSSEKVLKFDTIESEKPNSTSLKDLWIEVVGWTELNVSTKEDWLWTSVAKEILPLILFLLLLAIIFKFTIFDLSDSIKMDKFLVEREKDALSCSGCLWPSSFEAELLNKERKYAN